MKQILLKLYDEDTLNRDEAIEVIDILAQGKMNDASLASLISVFQMRPITIDEFLGFTEGMLRHKQDLSRLQSYDPIDIVGTGGDGKNTFNISTLACFTVAAAGYKVAKHGNYGVSSVSGASTVMEQLGIRFTSDSSRLERSLDACNITFLHAPLFNTGMKAAGKVRKELGIRTFFNMLGPVINPIQNKKILLGVYNLKMARLYQYMYQHTDVDFALVHSLDGYDEISLTSDFKVVDRKKESIIHPQDIGFEKLRQEALYGGSTPQEAAQIFVNVIQNKATLAQKQAVVVNAAYGIQLIEKKPLQECIAEAQRAMESGALQQTFEKFRTLNS